MAPDDECDYDGARAAAVRIVAAAAAITRGVQAAAVAPAVASSAKADASPVTVADYAAQAFITIHLAAAFPADVFIAEESAAALRASPRLLADVTAAVQLGAAALRHDPQRPPAPPAQEADVLAALDRAAAPGGDGRRTWVCDPIDGTRGYVARRQYCIALALTHRGAPVLGVLGCPSLRSSAAAAAAAAAAPGPDQDPGATAASGVVFHAVRGGGAYEVAEDAAAAGALGARVAVDASPDAAGAVFCESVEAAHSSHALAARVAGALGVKATPVRMDSQAKYGAMARGDFHIFMRFPRKGYVENVWDHAPAACVIAEAGGRVTDGRGRPLDFSKGRCLDNDDGIVASNGVLHDAVIDAVQRSLRETVSLDAP